MGDTEVLAKPEYWDERYSKSDGKSPTHEWFRSYNDLLPFLTQQLFEPYPPQQAPKILHLGAGDSVRILYTCRGREFAANRRVLNQTIPKDLLDYGYSDQVCIDFSPVLVKSMAAGGLDGITWTCGDVRDMPVIDTRSIDVAFDKGTLDAMIYGSPWDPPDEVKENTGRYMREVVRVLKDDGVFLYVTYRQPHFVKPLLNHDELWDLTMHVLQGGENSFEYYAFVLKKAL